MTNASATDAHGTGRTRTAVGLALLTLAVMAPNVVLLLHGRDTLFAWGVLAQAIFLWTFVVVAAGRWRALLWIALPLLLVAPGEALFVRTYGYPSSRHVLALIAETTRAETLEFFAGLWLPLIAALVVVVGAWLALRRWVPERRIAPVRWQLAAMGVLLAVTLGHDALRRVDAVPLAVRQFSWANAFPVGVAYRVAGFARYQLADRKARDAIARHRWNATTSADAMAIVVVIGESARPDHWSLNGYRRPTTPRLAAIDGVVSMPQLVTPWPLTRFAVPTVLKRKSATDTGVLAERSLIAAFREAGYETHWLANQDGLQEVSLHVGEAQFRKSFNLAVGRGDIDAELDGAMLADVDAALGRPGARQLVVLHTKGSHWDYHLRYPAEFAVFQPDRLPDGESGKYDRRNREVLVNAYDNSIRYTDHVLAEVIARLERRGGPAALVYVSDHGQGLYDDGCTMFGHGNDLEAAFRTSGLIWVSSAWRDRHAGGYAALRANAARPLGVAQTMFHTIADLGELSIAEPAHSLLRADFVPGRRVVNTSTGALDFDASSRAGACRLIVPVSP